MEQGQEITPETQCAIIRLSRLLDHDSIARCLDLSARTVKRIVTHFRAHGTIPYDDEIAADGEHQNNSHLRDVDIDFILGTTQRVPDPYLDELQEMLEVSRGVQLTREEFWRALLRSGYTVKKITRRAVEQSAAERLEYLARIRQYEAEQLVFVDESLLDRSTIFHGRAWSIKGTKAQRKAFLIGGKRFSVLPALSLEGIMHCEVVKGSFSTKSFTQFIERLLGYMRPYPAPNSVIVMEKCRPHNNPEILELIHARGMRYEFLPSYSRDLNPVELAFSSMKGNLRGNGDYERMATTEMSDKEAWLMLVKAFYILPSKDGHGWYSQCGYDNFHNGGQEPQSCSTVVLPQIPPTEIPAYPGLCGYPCYTFVFPGWGPPPVVYQAMNHGMVQLPTQPSASGLQAHATSSHTIPFLGNAPLFNADIPGMDDWLAYLDRHEARNKDGVTFSPYGPVLKANGFARLSQLPFDTFKLTDHPRQWNMKPGTAVSIMQYAKADLAAVRSGRLVIPKVHVNGPLD